MRKIIIVLLTTILVQSLSAQDSLMFKPSRFYLRLSGLNVLAPSNLAKYYQFGFGVGTGVNLYASNHFQLKLNLDVYNLVFDIQKYANDKALLNYDLESKDPSFIALAPELKYIPFRTRILVPYLMLGLKTLYGIQSGLLTQKLVKSNAVAKEESLFDIDFRYIPYFGLGTEVYITNQLNLVVDFGYQFEVLENTKPLDPFFQFKKPERLNMSYFQLNIGIGLKPFK